MKKVLQPLAWYLVLASVLAMASGVALSVATDMALATSGIEWQQPASRAVC
ncbi:MULTISPECIES: hypothetical protein [unclassified Pseudomonas]|uniref:hypothetical protein n=1 Tax=unclassified Pseudomonas TaxID=196821 RepID=UPI001EDE4B42|nr:MULTISPECIES: hypothetical protein [unclassified Pseudomonas]MCG4455939.1 hypothetical protein [Pseudomonas sp. MMS21 TM103]